MGRGYMGKILWVDLTTGRIRKETIPPAVYERYLSGMGLAAFLLYNRISPGADPLGPENILGFVSGLLTGTGSLFTGRWMVVGKSPLTGTWGDANCGGNFAPAIKQCGVDGIFFSGVSQRPVYFFWDGNKAELRDAGDLWGKDAIETEEILITKAGGKRKPRVASIGPAGEKLSLISGIVNDRGRLAARSGLGAVMGSKKLKAVVLAGAGRIPPNDRKEMKRLSRMCNEHVQWQPAFISGTMTAYMGAVMRMLPAQMETDGMLYKIMLRKWGTVSMNQMAIEMGDAPIKNWMGSNRDFGPDRSKLMNPDIITKSVISKYFCYSCPLGCGGILSGTGKFKAAHKPEYETVIALGGLLMNEDPESIFYLNEVLNRAGMDTISAGGTVAFAIECFERGILTLADTDGLDLTWGNTRAIVALIEKMIRREGIGDLLADGSKKAAERIQKNSIRYAMEAGGQELGMHDGRFDPGFALHNCVEPTPGRHTIGSLLYYEMFRIWEKIDTLPDPSFIYMKGSKFEADREKAIAGAACSKFVNLLNGTGCCLFGAFMGADRLPLFEWINAATGWRRTPEEYLEIGRRVQTLKQAFNIRHGIRPKEIRMSDRPLGRPPQEEGANQGRTIPIEKMMTAYWKEMGWDPDTGVPTREAMKQAGIDGPASG
jgi:aldehyde:ferredoxin oxidoreductase